MDADAALEFEVTEEDVALASVKKPQYCAVARAIHRVSPKIIECFIFRSIAWVQFNDKTIKRYKIPRSVQLEIFRFDEMAARNEPPALRFHPGVYQFSACSANESLAGLKANSKKRNAKRNKKTPNEMRRRVYHRTWIKYRPAWAGVTID